MEPVALAAPGRRFTGVVSPGVCSPRFKGESAVVHGRLQSDFSAFVSDGYVSLVGSDGKVPVKILRDTGASRSYIVSSVLPFSQFTATGDNVLMKGMDLDVLPVPAHKLRLDCGLVQGEVTMGVRPALPVQGVQVILGNDLAGSRVWADGPPQPVVTASPGVAEGFPGGGTAARTVCPREAESGLELSGTEDSGSFTVGLPDVFPSVSHSDLAAEQRADPSLSAMFNSGLLHGESSAPGYLVNNNLLLRKWVPKGKGFTCDPIFQIVVPSVFQGEVLRTSYGRCGHLGVRKMYWYIRKHFFWPHMKRDVSLYIKARKSQLSPPLSKECWYDREAEVNQVVSRFKPMPCSISPVKGSMNW